MKYRTKLFAWMLAGVTVSGLPPLFASTTNLVKDTNPLITGPNLSIAWENNRPAILFRGTLQTAGTVTGPWSDVVGAVSPYHPGTNVIHRFYRARTPDSIFASSDIVPLTLTGPFQQYFELAYAGLPDGINPPVREKPYFDGSLTMPGLTIPITLRVRGNSSLQECPFPKLKFKVSRETRDSTPFQDAREIKVGTHCAEGGRGTIGRLREQIATFREALAYETMATLGFVSPRVRRAIIDYHDTTPTNLFPQGGWQVVRSALLVDDVEVIGERLGGRALDDDEVAALTNANFNGQLIADLQFLHTLLGNWDYRLSVDGRNLWNTDVVELADGRLVPVAGDFDLASWVTGMVRLSVPIGYHPELNETERQARYQLEQLQQGVNAATFAAAGARFVVKRTVLESQISAAQIDEPGRTNCLRHVTAFYNALNAVSR